MKDIFSQLVGINWRTEQAGRNAVRSVQQTQQNIPAVLIIKNVAAVMDYVLWLFF